MTLEGERLETLVFECNKLVADKDYKSPACYTILSYMIKQLIKISRYHRYPKETQEQLELDAIIRCYTKIPRFSLEKANEARAKQGLKPHDGRSVHRYVQVIILSSFLTTLASLGRKRMVFVPIELLSMSCSTLVSLDETVGSSSQIMKQDSFVELASLKEEDIDAILDAATIEDRAREFETRLDKIQAQLDKQATKGSK